MRALKRLYENYFLGFHGGGGGGGAGELPPASYSPAKSVCEIDVKHLLLGGALYRSKIYPGQPGSLDNRLDFKHKCQGPLHIWGGG